MIGCLTGCLMMVVPRVALILVAVFTPYVGKVYGKSWLWPALGFVFLPITTLAYIFGMIQTNGRLSGVYVAVVVFGVLLDLGVLGSQRGRFHSLPRHE